jgi:hypothetical protein
MIGTLKESEETTGRIAVRTHVRLNPSKPVDEQNIEEQEDYEPAKT